MSLPEQTRVNELVLYRPPCSKCGERTTLARIKPSGERGCDLRTFECVTCGNEDVARVKFK